MLTWRPPGMVLMFVQTPDSPHGRDAMSTFSSRRLISVQAMHTAINNLSSAIIGAAIEVHRILGPGLLESAYEQCLAQELSLRDIPFERQKPLPVHYKGTQLDCGYRLDFPCARVLLLTLKTFNPL